MYIFVCEIYFYQIKLTAEAQFEKLHAKIRHILLHVNFSNDKNYSQQTK